MQKGKVLGNSANRFKKLLNKLRNKKPEISLGDISKEVEEVRSKRYGK